MEEGLNRPNFQQGRLCPWKNRYNRYNRYIVEMARFR